MSGATLFIRLGEGAGQASWLLADTQAQAAAQAQPSSGALELARAAASGQRVVAFAPATQVGLHRLSLPTGNRKRLAQALPYALEERLAEDVEALHFAIPPKPDPERLIAAVASRRQMRAWVEQLAAAGIQADALVSELHGVPFEEGRWTLLLGPRTAWVCTGPQEGFAADRDSLGVLLELALAEAGTQPPRALRVFASAADSEPRALLGARAAELPIDIGHWERDPVETLVRGYQPRRAIDLLQGPFARQQPWLVRWRPWRTAAGLAAAWLLVGGVADLIEAQGLKAESARLQAAIAATYRQAFPESRRLVNPKAQMEQGLAELRRRAQADAGGLPSLLTHAARALGEVPAVELKGLQYQQQEMDLTLQAPDLASLEEIRNRLSRTGAVQAELRSASTGSRQVEGQLRVRGVGP